MGAPGPMGSSGQPGSRGEVGAPGTKGDRGDPGLPGKHSKYFCLMSQIFTVSHYSQVLVMCN